MHVLCQRRFLCLGLHLYQLFFHEAGNADAALKGQHFGIFIAQEAGENLLSLATTKRLVDLYRLEHRLEHFGKEHRLEILRRFFDPLHVEIGRFACAGEEGGVDLLGRDCCHGYIVAISACRAPAALMA